jgi:RimJ/RimL family protein N-acetyltransferase
MGWWFRIMILEISNNISITEISRTDKSSYMRYLTNSEISKYTTRLPCPYKESDADLWLNEIEKQKDQHGKYINFAIRKDNNLIGGIGFVDYELNSHKAELGYWLAKEFWGNGIISKSVQAFIPYVMKEFKLVRLEAFIFHPNIASQKALLKNGFELEGVCKKYYFKNGEYFDRLIFAKVL